MTNTSKTPLISVIIPVYNTRNYIARCLDSILNQSIKNIEIILSDDLSTDNVDDIIIDYIKKYNFIKYFNMPSKGMAGGARNMGLTHALGKYISFVDSDDWIDENMLESMMYTLEKSNADIAVCGVITEYDEPEKSEARYEYKTSNLIEGKTALTLLSRQKHKNESISSIVCNKLYRTSFLKDNHFTFIRNNFNDDDVFNFICFLRATKVSIVPNTYYHYYQRQHSIMHVFSKKNIDDLFLGFEIIKNYLDNNNIYEENKNNFYSFFEKCLASVLGILKLTENNSTVQNDYIHYLINKCKNDSLLTDYIDYLDLARIINFLTPLK